MFGATINEIIEAEKEIVSNDITINSKTPKAEIMETIADIYETIEFESNMKKPVTMTILDYFATLKQLPLNHSSSGDVILAISKDEFPRERNYLIMTMYWTNKSHIIFNWNETNIALLFQLTCNKNKTFMFDLFHC